MPARTTLSYTTRVSSLRLTPAAHALIAQMAAADGLNRQGFLETLVRAEAARRHLPIPSAAGETIPPPALPVLEGAKVRTLRLAAGWSQGALARAAGTRTNTISRIERGGTSTRDLTALGVARALGVPLSALQGPAEPPPAGPP